MPRPKAPTIAAVTPELLRQTWDNENACRMWLRRRGTSPTKLGLVVVPDGDRVRVDYPRDPGVAEVKQPAAPVAKPSELEAFERYAEEVDDLLQAAGEGPELDAVVLDHMQHGLSVERAVEVIVARRHQSVPAIPDVVRDTARAREAAVHQDSVPVRNVSGVFVRLTQDMAFEEAVPLAAKASRFLGRAVSVCSELDGSVITTVQSKPAGASGKAAAKETGAWAKLVPLLERLGGCTVDEAKAVLGWQTAPGRFHFERWAQAAGREIIDMGVVDGVRVFGLRKAA